MDLLNLGCGNRYHADWTNLDFTSTSEYVIGHNLLKGIPFDCNTFDVVYHSHVLEHFSKADGRQFIKECYRVLRPGGIIRIAVPDLENIIAHYIKCLTRAREGSLEASFDYDWIMLELYDQAVRNESGGEMARYLSQERIMNREFVFTRIGKEATESTRNYFRTKAKMGPIQRSGRLRSRIRSFFRIAVYKNWLKKKLFFDELEHIEIGKFRRGGEIHQWMYDSFSLKRLLTEVGFSQIQVMSAFDSKIPEWNKFELESKNGIVYKPDSLFMEAIKNESSSH